MWVLVRASILIFLLPSQLKLKITSGKLSDTCANLHTGLTSATFRSAFASGSYLDATYVSRVVLCTRYHFQIDRPCITAGAFANNLGEIAGGSHAEDRVKFRVKSLEFNFVRNMVPYTYSRGYPYCIFIHIHDKKSNKKNNIHICIRICTGKKKYNFCSRIIICV